MIYGEKLSRDAAAFFRYPATSLITRTGLVASLPNPGAGAGSPFSSIGFLSTAIGDHLPPRPTAIPRVLVSHLRWQRGI